MRIGHQQGSGTAPQPVQKGCSAGAEVHQMGKLMVQGPDVKPGAAGPVVDAVELQLAVLPQKVPVEPLPRFVGADPLGLAVAGWHQIVPQVVVVVEVQQAAVHVQHDGVDLGPVNQGESPIKPRGTFALNWDGP